MKIVRTLASALAMCAAGLAGCANLGAPFAVDVPAPEVVAEVHAGAAAAVAAENQAVAEIVVAAYVQPPSADPPPLVDRGELDDRSARLDLWQRVRDGFGIADLDDTYVRSRERYYASRPDYVQRMTERGARYLFYIVEEVQRRELPTELALLPFVESAFNPQAMSRASASGMWQFMPGTGRDFELHQNVFRDDRRDVLASTRAALDYLTRLYGMFGDWHLALAAYNWGEGNVQRAILRNKRAGRPTDYASLKMPAETRDYVPKLQAVKNIVADPAAFALTLPTLQNHPYFLTVAISRDIDVDRAAQLAGLPLEEFLALNPQMNKPVILAAGTPQVLLPYENANQFVKAMAEYSGPLASWTAWVAPKTLKTAEAARLVGMSEHDLRSYNQIPPRMLVKAGSTLLVPRNPTGHVDVSEQVAAHARVSFAPDGAQRKRQTYRAAKGGESVAAVARRFRVSHADLAAWNDVTVTARFAAGSTVVVYAAAQAARPATKASAVTSATSRKAAAQTSARPVKVAATATAPDKR